MSPFLGPSAISQVAIQADVNSPATSSINIRKKIQQLTSIITLTPFIAK